MTPSNDSFMIRMDKFEEFIKKEEEDFEKERKKALECIDNLKNNIDDDWLADFGSCSMRMDAIANRIQAVKELKSKGEVA